MDWKSTKGQDLHLALSFLASPHTEKASYLPERFIEPIPFFGSGGEPMASNPLQFMVFFCLEAFEAHGGYDTFDLLSVESGSQKRTIQALTGILEKLSDSDTLQACAEVWSTGEECGFLDLNLWIAAECLASELLHKSGQPPSLSRSFSQIAEEWSRGS
jgi:hypothetical protein